MLTSDLFQSLFDPEIAIGICQVHKRFAKLPITLLLFWHLNVLYISKVLTFLDYILSLATANQNNSVINIFVINILLKTFCYTHFIINISL